LAELAFMSAALAVIVGKEAIYRRKASEYGSQAAYKLRRYPVGPGLTLSRSGPSRQ
jgi:hypothetical protein